MTTLILLLAVQIGSHKQIIIEANPLCANVPYLDYPIGNEIICLPNELIFKGGFE